MSFSIDPQSTIVRADGHLTADLGEGETALLGADLENYFGLNRVASRVWELAASPTTIDAICAALLEEFEVDRETCAAQVVDLVREMVENSLVRVVSISKE